MGEACGKKTQVPVIGSRPAGSTPQDANSDQAFEFIARRFQGEFGGSNNPLSHHHTQKDNPPELPEHAVGGLYLVR
jgi:hypothetical protein